MTPKLELYATVVASTLNDSFYEKANDRLKRIQGLIQTVAQKDPNFVAKLAVYAREKMYLRTVPLVLTIELAKIHNGDDLIRRLTARVIQRVDEITEILAYYQMANARKGNKKLNKLSKQLQKGIADAFNKFDEYQFAKYNRDADIKLRDALFLVHPKAKSEGQQKVFDKIVNNSLSTAYTWESQMSKAGQKDFKSADEKKQAFKKTWEELIMSKKMGYMAMLRNLRNILNAGVSKEAINKVVATLSNPYQVRRSKQFPFRFLAAYRELQSLSSGYTSQILSALESAILASADNIKGFDENTNVMITTDVSGSMTSTLSGKSVMQYKDVGLILSMLLKSKCANVVTSIFGHTHKVVQMPTNQIIANAEKLRRLDVGHSTNGYLAIKHLVDRKIKMDKVMVFTDCQLWSTNWGNNNTIEKQWKKYLKIAPNAKLYLFDLAGYGNTPLDTSKNNVFLIAGWSDKIFNILEAIENGSSAIKEIDKIKV